MTNNHQNGRPLTPFLGPIIALLWIFQLIFLSTAVATLALLIGTLKSSPFVMFGPQDEIITLPGLTPTPYVIMLTISMTLTLLTCIEIIAYFNTHLTPRLYLSSTIFKVCTWTAVVALDIWTISKPWIWKFSKEDVPEVITFYRIYLWIMLGGAIGVFIMFLLGLLYAVTVFMKHRRYMKVQAGAIANQL